jgi:hypothetical protein
MEYSVRLHLTTAAVVIGLGVAVSLITSSVVAARAYERRARETARRQETITVKGSTRQRIRSDRAVWRIGVRGEATNLAEAFAAIERSVQRVQAFLQEAGFQDAEIGLAAIDTEEQHKRDEKGQPLPEVVGYSLTRLFTVATDDVDRVCQSAGRVTELIRDGVLVTSRPPAYYYTELPKLRIDLMAAASADAKARADKIAASTGCRLGSLRDATMGVLQVTEPDSTETADAGMYDTATIAKDVTAVVTATFGVETR